MISLPLLICTHKYNNISMSSREKRRESKDWISEGKFLVDFDVDIPCKRLLVITLSIGQAGWVTLNPTCDKNFGKYLH
jgi:hypothetical protein